MGAVYRATQLNLNRTVAIKVMRGDVLADPRALERFRREALAIAQLNHPNIVTIHDFGLSPDLGAYLVMEHLAGRSLRSDLEHRGRLAVEEAVDILRQDR
jgi:serine/threonine protein kinase